MIYGVSEYDLRQALAEKNATVRAQTKNKHRAQVYYGFIFYFVL